MKLKNIENIEIEVSTDNKDGSVTKRYVDINSDEGKKLIKDHKIDPPATNEPNPVSEARKVLSDTHDIIVRSVDFNEPIPDDIKQRRQEAWRVIDSAKKDNQ